jgi:hypothetical protein
MDQLISKLTSLSYEIFGIFVPGFVFILFFMWTWWACDTLTPTLTLGYLPPLHYANAHDGVLNVELRFGLVVFLAIASYFLGHLMFWLSRIGNAVELDVGSKPTSWRKFVRGVHRIGCCLFWRIPKARVNYESALEPLLATGYRFLAFPDAELSQQPAEMWRKFYPVAKCRLQQDLKNSLVSTYQNKYTLHRSLCVVAIFWFWCSLLIQIAAPSLSDPTHQIHVAPIWITIVTCIATVWGFSGSFQYNWRMFGDTILTETFVLSKMSVKPKKEGDGKSSKEESHGLK